MQNNKPLILVTNDDGHEAKGLAALIEAAASFGEVVVISPDGPRSGMSHAITTNVPLRVEQYKNENGISFHRTNGTPVDCIKLAQKVVLRNRKIDLVLSGINHGANSSVSLLYSGTMAAAIEASFENIPAIGFSLLDYSPNANFDAATIIASNIIEKALKDGIPDHTSLNVNIPKQPIEKIAGIKVTRQTKGYWNEDLLEQIDPYGRSYYWLVGELVDTDHGEDSCEWALRNNYVSVQPVQFDLTAHQHINSLKKWEE
ncbi:MAG TPA: 5'/3'-nucleotidase SurE [Bacteroidales bacterium]|nr:5'/3'-nucleotidase SurE [Bacteroidales bacterium]HQQ20773.1 5'/3'-nucleotidase SurE [Bacteroidales bacterium]